MPLSFHGFSFDLFGFSWRQTIANDCAFAEAKSVPEAKSPAAKSKIADSASVREREAEDADEVSFRALCIFPIL
ncbi:hypothetical protein [Rhizobium oryziradicis]|uniref:Uncharacterized protein n=1 Tax=Rhizobium oryziradicis TaxID=1867956 RepID=A0A1Q8ZVN8_9HYPH|nr:hypothetical protein [Rhizobium oryziradicis]OLP45999.1 hypothetical protein BJF95_14900 [Rhizobium oryziradicis]